MEIALEPNGAGMLSWFSALKYQFCRIKISNVSLIVADRVLSGHPFPLLSIGVISGPHIHSGSESCFPEEIKVRGHRVTTDLRSSEGWWPLLPPYEKFSYAETILL